MNWIIACTVVAAAGYLYLKIQEHKYKIAFKLFELIVPLLPPKPQSVKYEFLQGTEKKFLLYEVITDQEKGTKTNFILPYNENAPHLEEIRLNYKDRNISICIPDGTEFKYSPYDLGCESIAICKYDENDGDYQYITLRGPAICC